MLHVPWIGCDYDRQRAEVCTPRKFVSSLREKEFVGDLDGLNEFLSVLTKYRLISPRCYTL